LNRAPIPPSVLPSEPNLYDSAQVPKPPPTQREKARAQRELKQGQRTAEKKERDQRRAEKVLEQGLKKSPNPSRSQQQSHTSRNPGPVETRRAQKAPQGLQAQHTVFAGYGALRTASDKKSTQEAAKRGVEHTNKIFAEWNYSPMVWKFHRSKDSVFLDFKKAWEALSPSPFLAATEELLREDYEGMALRYGEVAKAAHNLGNHARAINKEATETTKPFTEEDIKKLDALADATWEVAMEMAHTFITGNNPNANAYGSRKDARNGDWWMGEAWESWTGSEVCKSLRLETYSRRPRTTGRTREHTEAPEGIFSRERAIKLAKSLEDTWKSRKPVPYDEWTAGYRLSKVAGLAYLLWEEFSKKGGYPGKDLEGLVKLGSWTSRHGQRLLKSDPTNSFLPKNPKELRERNLKEAASSTKNAPRAQQPRASVAAAMAQGRGPSPMAQGQRQGWSRQAPGPGGRASASSR